MNLEKELNELSETSFRTFNSDRPTAAVAVADPVVSDVRDKIQATNARRSANLAAHCVSDYFVLAL